MHDLNFGPGAKSRKSSGNSQLGSQFEPDLKPCPILGCPELIPEGARGCTAHKNVMTVAEAERRKNHPRNLIYKDPRWKMTRRVVFTRDDWTCVYCGHHDFMNETRSLSCDHANEGGVMACPDPFDPSYCVTSCNTCSGRKDGKRGGTRSA